MVPVVSCGAAAALVAVLLGPPTGIASTLGASAGPSSDCGEQLDQMLPVAFDEELLRNAIEATVRGRIGATAVGVDAGEIATLASRFLAERCFGTPDGYCTWRVGEGARPSPVTVDEFASGNIEAARASLGGGDPLVNRADALLGLHGSAAILVDCAIGTVGEPAVLGVLGGSDAMAQPQLGSRFWHTSEVASGVREFCLPEEATGAPVAREATAIGIGVVLRYADGTRAPVHVSIARAADSGRLAVVGYWRFAPCGEQLPSGINLSF